MKAFKVLLIVSCVSLLVVSLQGCDQNGRGKNDDVNKWCGFGHANNSNCQ